MLPVSPFHESDVDIFKISVAGTVCVCVCVYCLILGLVGTSDTCVCLRLATAAIRRHGRRGHAVMRGLLVLTVSVLEDLESLLPYTVMGERGQVISFEMGEKKASSRR